MSNNEINVSKELAKKKIDKFAYPDEEMQLPEYLNDKKIKKEKILRIIKAIFLFAFLTFFALFIFMPFYWMVATSFKSIEEVNSIPAKFLPTELFRNVNIKEIFSNYAEAFGGRGRQLLRYIGNTVFVAFCSTILILITTVFAAFAFSRLEFKGKNMLFSLLLATMMIPGEILLITNFMTVSSFGWLDTYFALIFTHCVSVFYIFFLRQNFMQIPNELYYAAKVDGKNDFQYLFRVMIPIAKPALISITILSAIGSWNAFIWPSLVATSDSMQLVTSGLVNSFMGDMAPGDNVVMAASFVVTLPLLVVFMCFKKFIMRGASRSGIKG